MVHHHHHSTNPHQNPPPRPGNLLSSIHIFPTLLKLHQPNYNQQQLRTGVIVIISLLSHLHQPTTPIPTHPSCLVTPYNSTNTIHSIPNNHQYSTLTPNKPCGDLQLISASYLLSIDHIPFPLLPLYLHSRSLHPYQFQPMLCQVLRLLMEADPNDGNSFRSILPQLNPYLRSILNVPFPTEPSIVTDPFSTNETSAEKRLPTYPS